MVEVRRVAVVIDGGLYSGFAERAGVDDTALLGFIRQVERAVGGRVIHVTYADADSQDYLVQHIDEGLVEAPRIAALAVKSAERCRRVSALPALLGANRVEVKMSGYRLQHYRTPVAAPPSLQEPCVYRTSAGLVQDMCDVDVCVRIFEYAHGLVTSANGTPILPSDIVLLAKDSDLAHALHSVAKTAPQMRVWLAALQDEHRPAAGGQQSSQQQDGGASGGKGSSQAGAAAADPLGSISRALEAYIPRRQRFLLHLEGADRGGGGAEACPASSGSSAAAPSAGGGGGGRRAAPAGGAKEAKKKRARSSAEEKPGSTAKRKRHGEGEEGVG